MEATSLHFIDFSHKFSIIPKEKSCKNYTNTVLITANGSVTANPATKQQIKEVNIEEQSSKESKTNRFYSKCHKSKPKGHKEVCLDKENPVPCDGFCEWSNCPVKKHNISNINKVFRATTTMMASLSKGITAPQTFMKVFAVTIKPIL
jgi:hypothetical protein